MTEQTLQEPTTRVIPTDKHGNVVDGDIHIVDVLIEERAQQLMKRPMVWSIVKRIIYPLLRYGDAVTMADAVAYQPADRALEYVSDLLTVQLELTGKENIPHEGRFILAANHPTGIADGVAVYDALKDIRPDMCFFANRDALRVNPLFEERIIPVEWVMDERNKAKTRDMVKRMVRAFRDENAVIMFPSGRLALPTKGGIREQDWFGTTVNIARRNNAPIIPTYMGGRNSWLYYLFHLTNNELRDMTLFNELLNKKNYRFPITFGAPIGPDRLEGDPHEVAQELKSFVEDELARDPRAVFRP